ncbi:MAG: RNA polymerase sigma factor [Thermoanaerobaculaceae bacterium]|jgi:RNA polymerase sigma-70 factor (ECF subfamily)|nr:RNA polymerase sigma factor [Thermoanaerobaculaceae bacterium]
MRTRERVVDEILVLAAQAGRTEALERLAVRWYPKLARHARRLTGDTEGARDVVQESWIAIARGLGHLRDAAAFPAWALRIVTRRAAEWVMRQQKARVRYVAIEHVSDLAAPQDKGGDDLARVRDALRLLDRQPRLLLAMLYVDGLSVAEIAAVLEIPTGTVKSRLYHARARLREALEVPDDAHDRR